MHKILGSRLAEIYNTTHSKHTKKVLENVSNIAKSSNLSIQQTIPVAERALEGCKDDEAVKAYFQSDVNAALAINVGIKEAITKLKGLPIYEHNEAFKDVVDNYDSLKENGTPDYRFINLFMNDMSGFMWNSKVNESIMQLKGRATDSLPYMLISNTYDALEEYKGKAAYSVMFQRLNTAMSLPANMIAQYIIKNMGEYMGIEAIAELVDHCRMLERSWLSRLMPKTTSVITRLGRFKTTGLNTPVVKMNEQTVFMAKNRLFSIKDGKIVKEYKEYKKLPVEYKKLYEGIVQQNAEVEDDMAICTTVGTNGHQVCVQPGDQSTTVFIDGVAYDAVDDAVNKMVEFGMDNAVIDSMLDIFAYCEGQICSMDNAIQISDENGGATTIILVLEPNNISVMVMDGNLIGESKIYNNLSAIQTTNFIKESYDINIAHLLKEGIEMEQNDMDGAAVELAKYKQEMVDIELTIQKIESLSDESKNDPEMKQYHNELLLRQKEIRNQIADAQSRADGKGGIDENSPASLSGKIYDNFEKLRKNMLSIKDNDTNTTTLEGERVDIGDGFSATPVLTVDEYQHDVVKSVVLKITDETGSNAGVPERINQKFKSFGFSVIDGNELNLTCTMGSLDMPFDDTLKGSVEAVITKLTEEGEHMGDIGTEETPDPEEHEEGEGKEKEGYQEAEERGKDDGAKPPVPNKDDEGEKPKPEKKTPPVEDDTDDSKKDDTATGTDTNGSDIFKGELNKYSKDDLVLIAKAKDKEMGTMLEKIFSGTSINTFDVDKLNELSKFLTDKGETNLAAFVGKQTKGNDDLVPPKEKSKEEKEADIASTREVTELLDRGGDIIAAIREARIAHKNGDKFAMLKVRKLQEAMAQGVGRIIATPELKPVKKTNLKSRPTMESWKESLSSRHMKVRYTVLEDKIVARSANGGKVIGIYPVNESETTGYINAELSKDTEQIPSNTQVMVNAQQFLAGTKDANIDVLYGDNIYQIPKSMIVVNLLEWVNESTLLPLEYNIIKMLFKEHKSVDELAEFTKQKIDEGLFGEIVGGLTGFALGNKIGEMVAKCLGVGQGILYDLLTSRLFGAAIGSAIGDNM